MSSIIRFDPFRDLDRLTEQMMLGGGRGSPRSFPMDAYRRGDQFFVHLDLPGVEADSIELTAENNMLTVSAERRFESEEDDQVVIRERPQGQFTRQLLLGDSLDVDRIEANYENGVLTLSIPVAEQAKPRRISVGNSGEQQTIEGASIRT
ncbi:MAG TPA: Hsp20/alpha crystallin family protein [Gaiellaceae bacterium]|nr:Hsp20/alpha crystallin family protein [Gaiellaceae bacterium]